MRRDEYERSYGRRSHAPPPLPSPAEDPRSRRSRTKMKCLISIGLILPALAAVIGVAAWAVSADVVMNSGNANNRVNKADNNLLQNLADSSNDDRRDIFRMNDERQRPRPADTQPEPNPRFPTRQKEDTQPEPNPRFPPRPKEVATQPPPPAPKPPIMSAKEATDVNAILSKLISASGAASGGSGPRFVVVAPLPDNPEVLATQGSVSRADQSPRPEPVASASVSRSDYVESRTDHSKESKTKTQESSWQVSLHSDSGDLMASESQHQPHAQVAAQAQPQPRDSPKAAPRRANTSNGGDQVATRRVGEKKEPNPFVINLSTGGNFPRIELTGFDQFDSMMQSADSSAQNPVVQNPAPPPPPPGFMVSGPYSSAPKRGPYNSRPVVPMASQHYETKDPHVFNPHPFKPNHGPPHSMMPHHGLKPIQQQLLHLESNAGAPQRLDESRWGAIGFHPPPPSFVHKPPEGISLSISQPANHGAHVSAAEPVSVIKSFFLPFLPRPKLNMNARVVFGVVLDKGMGLGGAKKEAGHRHHY